MANSLRRSESDAPTHGADAVGTIVAVGIVGGHTPRQE
jgi:hypothetical protein